MLGFCALVCLFFFVFWSSEVAYAVSGVFRGRVGGGIFFSLDSVFFRWVVENWGREFI